MSSSPQINSSPAGKITKLIDLFSYDFWCPTFLAFLYSKRLDSRATRKELSDIARLTLTCRSIRDAVVGKLKIVGPKVKIEHSLY